MDSHFERDFAHAGPPSPLQSLNSHQYPSKSELKSNRAPSAHTTSELITPHDPNGPSWGRILTHGVVVIASLIALITVFLYLVFSRAVKDVTGDNLSSDVYVVNVSATVLLLPATLSAIVAICSISSVVFLSSCLHARNLVSKPEAQRLAILSGRDAGLLVELLTGRISACWSGIKYSIIHAGRSARPQIIFASLLISVLVLKSLLIFTSDVWLHATTRTVGVQGPTAGSQPADFWGRALDPECTQNSSSQTQSTFQMSLGATQCPVQLGTFTDDAESEAYQTARNASFLNRVILSGNTALLTDAGVPPGSSYSASTMGMTTSCTLIGQNCQMSADELIFNCSKQNFAGTFTRPFGLATVNDSSAPPNSIPFLVAVNINGTQGEFERYSSSPSVVVSRRNSVLLTVFECSSEVFELKFAQANGNVQIKSSTPADLAASQLILSPMLPGMMEGYSGFGLDLLAEAMATTSNATTLLQQISDSFAIAFSQITMASATASTTPILIDGDLTSYLLTTVPKAAVWLLVIADGLYALLALGLTIGALICCSNPAVRDVQAQLTIRSLTAKAFQQEHRLTTVRDYQDPYT
ncbi:hypothetical protein AOQ84DRAFT_76925 [Glonium stellatum]|uniref:Transmembrane protein n=1 Tax=Glonium stellatum TaxID=574774 RepID=A0A8E2JY94_9PEZI|nr:hypothetical protein AOQ84DRAFT_76925 [Glonium stellatum]